MRGIWLIPVIPIFIGWNLLFCQDEHAQYEFVQLVGTITPRPSTGFNVIILVDGKGYSCPDRVHEMILCVAHMPSGIGSARIEITALGYKRYSINVPHVSFEHGFGVINIGTVHLERSELPTVEQVLAGSTKDKNHRVFELTLQNRLVKDIAIKRIRIIGYGVGHEGTECCCPPRAIFDVSEELRIIGGSKSVRIARGEYREKVRGREYVFPMNAAIGVDVCNYGKKLDLSLAVSILIPRSSYSAIQLILPEKFTLKGGMSPKEQLDRLKIGSMERLSQFVEFEFVLSTGQNDEQDITTGYKEKP